MREPYVTFIANIIINAPVYFKVILLREPAPLHPGQATPSSRYYKCPSPAILSREEAKALGLERYFTGKPCRNGHIADRSVRGVCLECRSE